MYTVIVDWTVNRNTYTDLANDVIKHAHKSIHALRKGGLWMR